MTRAIPGNSLRSASICAGEGSAIPLPGRSPRETDFPNEVRLDASFLDHVLVNRTQDDLQDAHGVPGQLYRLVVHKTLQIFQFNILKIPIAKRRKNVGPQLNPVPFLS
jgi:hypothetical protein